MVQTAVHHIFGDHRSLACRDESNKGKMHLAVVAAVDCIFCKLTYYLSNVVSVSAILHVLGFYLMRRKCVQRATIILY